MEGGVRDVHGPGLNSASAAFGQIAEVGDRAGHGDDLAARIDDGFGAGSPEPASGPGDQDAKMREVAHALQPSQLWALRLGWRPAK